MLGWVMIGGMGKTTPLPERQIDHSTVEKRGGKVVTAEK